MKGLKEKLMGFQMMFIKIDGDIERAENTEKLIGLYKEKDYIKSKIDLLEEMIGDTIKKSA